MSRPKELDFFTTSLQRARGAEWYRRHFDADKRIRAESSPNYTAAALPWERRRPSADPHHVHVPKRMHALIPDAKLIYMVRDPVERIRAQWSHLHARGLRRKPLESPIRERGSTFLARSSYCFQLERFLERYPLDRIMVIDQDDLLHRRRQTLAAVFRFLGIDAEFWDSSYEDPVFESRHLQRRTRLGMLLDAAAPRRVRARLLSRAAFSTRFEQPPISDRLRAELAERLAGDAARFRALTGRQFEHWSV